MSRKKRPTKGTSQHRKEMQQGATTDLKVAGRREALDSAIRCFGKLPTTSSVERKFDLPYDLEFQGIDKISNSAAARGLCAQIASSYLRAKEAEASAMSPSEVIKKLDKLRQSLRTSADDLRSLGVQGRLMIHVLDDLQDAAEVQQLVQLYNGAQPEDLPELGGMTADGKPRPGSLAEAMEAVAAYLEALVPVLRKRYRKKRSGPDGLKIRKTAAGQFMAPPEWTLIDQAWRLFDRLGLEPSSTVGCPTHQFARNIHQWCTGRTDGLDFYFKRYAKARLRHNSIMAELQSLADQVPGLDRRQLELDAKSSSKSLAPKSLLAKAKRLVIELDELDDHLHFGT